jgi:hypothetical protein
MIRMNHAPDLLGCRVVAGTLVPAAEADNSGSATTRNFLQPGLSAGKPIPTCKSYAYIFNVKTSEYYRCRVSLR